MNTAPSGSTPRTDTSHCGVRSPQPYPGAPPVTAPGVPVIDPSRYRGSDADAIRCHAEPLPPFLTGLIAAGLEGGLGMVGGALGAPGGPAGVATAAVGAGAGYVLSQATQLVRLPACIGATNGHGGSNGNGFWSSQPVDRRR